MPNNNPAHPPIKRDRASNTNKAIDIKALKNISWNLLGVACITSGLALIAGTLAAAALHPLALPISVWLTILAASTVIGALLMALGWSIITVVRRDRDLGTLIVRVGDLLNNLNNSLRSMEPGAEAHPQDFQSPPSGSPPSYDALYNNGASMELRAEASPQDYQSPPSGSPPPYRSRDHILNNSEDSVEPRVKNTPPNSLVTPHEAPPAYTEIEGSPSVNRNARSR